jgi:hypothetical protein
MDLEGNLPMKLFSADSRLLELSLDSSIAMVLNFAWNLLMIHESLLKILVLVENSKQADAALKDNPRNLWQQLFILYSVHALIVCMVLLIYADQLVPGRWATSKQKVPTTNFCNKPRQ